MIGGIGWQELLIILTFVFYIAVVAFAVRFAVRLYKRLSSSATPKDESSAKGPWWFRIAAALVATIVFVILFEMLFG
jgi:divalent metal cation (Fe/Co/Zn/Cd) transporter